MLQYNEKLVDSLRRQSQAFRDKPATELSLAEDKVNRQRAAEAAEEILDQFPEVHSMLVNAYEVWSVWELEVLDIFDKNGNSLPNQDEINRFIVREAISYSEFIRPFLIHAGEIISLHELITAAKEDRSVNYGHLENDSFDKGLQTRTRLVPSKIFAIQFLENEKHKNLPPVSRLARNTDQQKKNLLELQAAISKEGMKLRLGDPKLDQDETGAITAMTLMVNGELSDGMAIHRLVPGDWLVVEPLSDEPLGEKLTNEQFRKRF